VFGVRPQVRVEPRQLIGGGAPQRSAQYAVARVEDRELREELLGFAQRIRPLEQRPAVRAAHSRNDGHEFQHRLVRYTHRILLDAAPKQGGCKPLLVGKAGSKR
jgi:hypothetical protein